MNRPHAERPGPVVLKVGGSLLEWPELPGRLAAVLREQDRPKLLIAGGGAIVDTIRRIDAVHGLGDERSHWLAIQALDLTARLLSESCGVGPIVDDPDRAFDRREPGETPVLAPLRWLRGDREAGLLESWDVTSDSIAAWLASRIGGDLVLLKSTPIDESMGIDQAVRLGLIDPVFPVAAAGVAAVWYRNLRDPRSVNQRLRHDSPALD